MELSPPDTGTDDQWKARAFEAAFEALPVAAFLVTRDGIVRFANAPGRAWLDTDRAARRATIRAAARGGSAPFRVTVVSESLSMLVHDPLLEEPSRGPRDRSAPLTTRERDVLELLAHGATYDEIAKMLTITTNTIRTHVRSLYEKLHACSKTEAVREAVRLGYVAMPRAAV
jgi:DNA-binding NarL/FixJ family response regulator